MSDTDPKLEKLFDQSMNESEMNLLREAIGSEELNNQIRLQDKIENSIRKRFECEAVNDQNRRGILIALGAEDVSSSGFHSWKRPGLLALAASLFLAIVIGYYCFSQPSNAIRFNQVSLVKLYDDSVDRGFRPYYDCSEPKRFAAEFKRRQGVELRLDTMSPGQAMLGVSYLGGISRNTTAVLFEDGESPVIVFVDKMGLESDELLTQNQNPPAILVHKSIRYGLVFYEVSKSPKPQMTKYFQLAD